MIKSFIESFEPEEQTVIEAVLVLHALNTMPAGGTDEEDNARNVLVGKARDGYRVCVQQMIAAQKAPRRR